jgi:DNA invertase Pin-like site-specific DNA recombinase
LIALYARVSTRDKNQNPETQLIQLREWAQRQGAEFTEFVDLASGKDLNRPAWKDLTTEWRKGRIDTIAVVRLDRAFRSVTDMHTCFDEWDGRGIRFASITQPVDTGTPTGKLLTTVLGAVAEFERDLTRERVKEGLARARRDGKKLGRPKARLSPERAARVLEENGGDLEKTLEILRVSKATFYRRLKKVG